MRFEYDKEANALYIYLRGKIPEGGVARTVELAPGVYLDADGAGRILGVEFLDFAVFTGVRGSRILGGSASPWPYAAVRLM